MREAGGKQQCKREFYAFSRTVEEYKQGQNRNSVVILTTDSDYYRYLKRSGGPAAARPTR